MEICTKHFGNIKVDQDLVIYFGKGIPGFEQAKKFIILGNEEDLPFRWLQSVDLPELAFVLVDPFLVKGDYQIDINDEIMGTLGIESAEDLNVFAIVVVPEDTSKMSMNLKAPVIINTKNNRGMQVALDTEEYGVRHYILDELRKQEVEAYVGSNKEDRPVNHCK